MGIRAIKEDMEQIKLLRHAVRALGNIDVRVNVPRLKWLMGTDTPQVDFAVARAASAVVRGQWTRAQFRTATVAALQSQIDEIVAKYPGLDLSN